MKLIWNQNNNHLQLVTKCSNIVHTIDNAQVWPESVRFDLGTIWLYAVIFFNSRNKKKYKQLLACITVNLSERYRSLAVVLRLPEVGKAIIRT